MGAELVPGMHPQDLIPGDPEEVERLVGRFRTFAGGMTEAAERLVSIQAGEWRGLAGDAFRSLIQEHPQKYHTAGSAFSQAATALTRYAETLREAQADAARAIALYEDSHRQTQAWQGEQERYDAETRAATLNNTTPATPRPPGADPGAGGRARAHQLFEDARSRVDAQARTSAASLRAAEEAAPHKPGLLAALTGATGGTFASLGGALTGAWDATTGFLEDAAGWVSDTWEDIDGPDLLRVVGGAAGVVVGVVAAVAGVEMAAAGVVALVPGTVLIATGVGAVPGGAIDLGGLGLVAGGLALAGGGAFLTIQSSHLLNDGISGLIMHHASKKESRASGKERGSDIPSWAKGKQANPGETPAKTAERLCDEKYGKGNYKKGPGSEYNKIKKYFERNK